MAEQFHYPPEIFNLLVDTIPLLCRSKRDVIGFFQGAGVAPEDLAEVDRMVRTARDSISKFEIARNILTRINARGDSGLRARRELIKRVTEFDSFESCWDADRLKAKGLVSELSKTVNVKDSFTRMKQEREAQREQVLVRQRTEMAAVTARRTKVDEISIRLGALFSMDDKPHERGKLLEGVLNDLFRAYGILLHEDFRRKSPETGTTVEQIDGIIDLNGVIHLVEMKWLNAPIGKGDFAQHICRVFTRSDVHGVFIAANGYTDAVISECRDVLNLKTVFLCSLREFVLLLQRQGDLTVMLRRKSQAAIVDKNPFVEILS
jgi:hypothetical protein